MLNLLINIKLYNILKSIHNLLLLKLLINYHYKSKKDIINLFLNHHNQSNIKLIIYLSNYSFINLNKSTLLIKKAPSYLIIKLNKLINNLKIITIFYNLLIIKAESEYH